MSVIAARMASCGKSRESGSPPANPTTSCRAAHARWIVSMRAAAVILAVEQDAHRRSGVAASRVLRVT
jgi:hypothetical protein